MNLREQMNILEQTFTCPHCWETISVFVDPSAREQTYIEDCSVCCRPIRIHVVTQGNQIISFDAQPTQ